MVHEPHTADKEQQFEPDNSREVSQPFDRRAEVLGVGAPSFDGDVVAPGHLRHSGRFGELARAPEDVVFELLEAAAEPYTSSESGE